MLFSCDRSHREKRLTRDGGERPSIERAACFIDIKRVYLENPRAARIYTAMHLDEELLAVFRPLGVRVLEDLSVEQDGRRVETLMLDFGPGGIPSWIARLVDALYGAPAPRFGLDASSRALVLDGQSVPLTRLEYGVMDYLAGNEGRVVTRDEMLREIWQQPFGGSNVVDAVIRTLRKKLRSDGRAIETVKDTGIDSVGLATRRLREFLASAPESTQVPVSGAGSAVFDGCADLLPVSRRRAWKLGFCPIFCRRRRTCGNASSRDGQ